MLGQFMHSVGLMCNSDYCFDKWFWFGRPRPLMNPHLEAALVTSITTLAQGVPDRVPGLLHCCSRAQDPSIKLLWFHSRGTLNVEVRHLWERVTSQLKSFCLPCCHQCSKGTGCGQHIKAGASLPPAQPAENSLKTLVNAPILLICDSD